MTSLKIYVELMRGYKFDNFTQMQAISEIGRYFHSQPFLTTFNSFYNSPAIWKTYSLACLVENIDGQFARKAYSLAPLYSHNKEMLRSSDCY